MASKKTPTHDNAKKAHSSAEKSAGSKANRKKNKPDRERSYYLPDDTLSEYEHGQAWERGDEFETDPDESATDGDI